MVDSAVRACASERERAMISYLEAVRESNDDFETIDRLLLRFIHKYATKVCIGCYNCGIWMFFHYPSHPSLCKYLALLAK